MVQVEGRSPEAWYYSLNFLFMLLGGLLLGGPLYPSIVGVQS